MSDFNSNTWRDIIQTAASIFAMVMAVIAIVRSSKAKQNDEIKEINKKQSNDLEKIRDVLNDHILQDSEDISTLKANVANLQDICNEKLDKILDAIEDK